jgi:hypothetical protein
MPMCKLCARKRINDSASKIFLPDRYVGNGAHNREASAVVPNGASVALAI